MKIKASIIVLLSFFLLAGCVSEEDQPVAQDNKPVATISDSAPAAMPEMDVASPTLIPPAEIKDAVVEYLTGVELSERQPPEDWQTWPVIPELTHRSYEIYYQGQLLGNNSQAFSKVGDCQNVKDAFLGRYDDLLRYPLATENAELADTVANFSGYFDTDGQAVRGGFNAATVLSPLRADQAVCLSGENPLDCELRLTRPSIVFVSFEVWWEGRTVETYEKYMRQVIEAVIESGAVPVLATKADNIEGDHTINLATAQLATEYDIPLWNFWAAVQPLANQGMDTERNDGFHISPDSWNMRSLTALQTLDHLWENLSGIQAEKSLSDEITEPNIQYQAPESLNWDYAENILFDLSCTEDVDDCVQGLFRLDLLTQETSEILLGDYELEAVSPDAMYLLLSQGTDLYVAHRENGEVFSITNSLYKEAEFPATWVSDSTFAFLELNEDRVSLAFHSIDGTSSDEFLSPTLADTPSSVYSLGENGYFYWETLSCSNENNCGIWGMDVEKNQFQVASGDDVISFSLGENYLAYPVAALNGDFSLRFNLLDGSFVRDYPLPKGSVEYLAWSPVDDLVALTLSERSDYSGRVLQTRNFVIDLSNWGLVEYGADTNEFASQLLWSSTGESLFSLGTEELSENRFQISATCLNGCEEYSEKIPVQVNTESDVPFIIHRAFWLSSP